MNIETERLVLTPVSEKYIEKIYQHFNEKVTKYMFPSPAKNIDETRNVVMLNSFTDSIDILSSAT